MLPDKRWTFRIVAVILLVAVGWWVLDEDTHEPLEVDPEDAEQRPDYFMETFTMHATSDEGTPTYQVVSPRMEHFQGRDLWLMDRPEITYFVESGEPWHLRAERGRATNNVENVHLQGEVEIRRAGGSDNLPANVDTSEVHLEPERRYAETDRHAVYWRDGARIEGVGVRAYLDRELVELLSEVRGRYDVPE
ncbi:LPS export ABC transporter periplasmic protein LptC [Aquisalimonas sp.]|uniref:LPS export ABC transporter periplasmic protein LptC n=1 Tax=unclassified Aquisalimonas TaxID=2644645 RepID=UPI0025BCA0B0|nr:LPS export ABC transporter periplasmic protein LptC [Aquisalimonas sp.]